MTPTDTLVEETKAPPAPRWDLEPIFPGGSGSQEFSTYRKSIKTDLAALTARAEQLPDKLNDQSRPQWRQFILDYQALYARIARARAFAHALVSQNVRDSAATDQEAEMQVYVAGMSKIQTSLEAFALTQSDRDWESFVSQDGLSGIRYSLDEIRSNARLKMPADKEALVEDLAVNGYHAWNRIYDKMYGEALVDFTESDGTTSKISLGQLQNKMGSGDRATRKQALDKLNAAWDERKTLAAMMLNALAGYRLSWYKHRNWESYLQEPLLQSRMKRETLDAMWLAVAEGAPKLKPYIQAKKKLLGIPDFGWHDQLAPVGESSQVIPFDEAGDFVVRNVGSFSDDIAKFCRMALDKRWIEAEDRPGKAGGGYCSDFGEVRECRIFMTYTGTYNDLETMAHELGHAYHSWCLRDVDYFATDYPLGLAETASIFNEQLTTDAALSQSTDRQQKLQLLDQKLQGALAFFCNIRARFLFDCSFYERRSQESVSADMLSSMMADAQKKAYGDLLSGPDALHPLFWASKLHFFISAAPFYNFPYTFGFLFANGVYAQAKKEGAVFAEKFAALLRDTGSMSTEDVAQKHLGVDLTRPDFWREAVGRALEDVPRFVELVV